MGNEMLVEDMPVPAHGRDFPRWVVPARSNIQRQLLRLQELLGHPDQTPTPALPPVSIMVPLNYLAGVGFSLWRAVFQAAHSIDREANMEEARWFVDQVIRNNAAVYTTELNAWSLGYYMGNSRMRIQILAKSLLEKEVKRSNELLTHVEKIEALARIRRDANAQHTQRSQYDEWETCFHCMRLMLDIVEQRIRDHAHVTSIR